MSDTHKRCITCRVEKPLGEFDVRRNACQSCRVIQRRRSAVKTTTSWLRQRIVVAKKRAIKRSMDFSDDVTIDYLISLLARQDGLCALTGVHMTHGGGMADTAMSIDRIDSGIGYIPGNLQLVCHRVNVMKMDMPDDQLWWWAKNLVTHDERREDHTSSEEAED